ncbi:hypothetical protein V6N13_033835 [Hibiscus sabdariffa]
MALVFQEVVHRPVAELSGIAMEGGFAGSLRLLGNVLFLKLSYVVFMLGWSGVNSLVLYIQEALQRQRLWEVVERHVPPSSNMVTDPLERLAHHTSFEVVVLEQPSLECAEALQRDGVTWEKMKAMEEIVEFLGVFCGDKVACVSKACNDFFDSLSCDSLAGGSRYGMGGLEFQNKLEDMQRSSREQMHEKDFVPKVPEMHENLFTTTGSPQSLGSEELELRQKQMTMIKTNLVMWLLGLRWILHKSLAWHRCGRGPFHGGRACGSYYGRGYIWLWRERGDMAWKTVLTSY